jgi:uncharacterized protein (DUF362 family)
LSRDYFRSIAAKASTALEYPEKALRYGPYMLNDKSIVALVRCRDRIKGLTTALKSLGGMEKVVEGRDGYVLVKPNCNSDDPFPASTHPDTLRFVLKDLLRLGVPEEDIIVGDMSGPIWQPTRETMLKNEVAGIAKEFNVKISYFDEEEWVHIKPQKARTWPDGFRIAKTVYNASRIISLPVLKTHQHGGVFTLSLKNSVGTVNPADRSFFHQSPDMRNLIAELNLGHSTDLIILDGMKCFVTGGPATGTCKESEVIIAGSDRVAVDAVGVSILKFHNADGIKDVPVKDQEQIRRAGEIGIGNADYSNMIIKESDLVGDSSFNDMVQFVKHQII